jgi:hypothetical protein
MKTDRLLSNIHVNGQSFVKILSVQKFGEQVLAETRSNGVTAARNLRTFSTQPVLLSDGDLWINCCQFKPLFYSDKRKYVSLITGRQGGDNGTLFDMPISYSPLRYCLLKAKL